MFLELYILVRFTTTIMLMWGIAWFFIVVGLSHLLQEDFSGYAVGFWLFSAYGVLFFLIFQLAKKVGPALLVTLIYGTVLTPIFGAAGVALLLPAFLVIKAADLVGIAVPSWIIVWYVLFLIGLAGLELFFRRFEQD